MRGHPALGLILALFGALVLTPDALLLRLSGLAPLQLMGWRGILMGGTLTLGWLIFSRGRRCDLRLALSGWGLAIMACQFANTALFCFGIGTAPVAMVLLGIATVPVFSALLGWLLLGEPTRRATWITIAVVMAGIAVAVFGGAGASIALDRAAMLGVLCGLGAAVVLALNFVILRTHPDLPIPLVIGAGALMAGIVATSLGGPAALLEGRIWAMALTGVVVLPVSFFCLSLASRYTQAANVSLLMLLETVLGPLWVWLVIGEQMTAAMLAGGAIVVLSVAIYVIHTGRGAARPTAPVHVQAG